MRVTKSITALVLLATSCSGPALHSVRVTVPIDLYEFAISEGCHPPGDFFEARPGVEHPPYVYATDPLSPQPAAAVWCEQSLGSREYTLLFRGGGGDAGQGSSPNRIPSQQHIGGLSLASVAELDLRDFRFVSNPSRPGPAVSSPSGVSIHSEYDGVGEQFYCYNGEWLFRVFH